MSSGVSSIKTNLRTCNLWTGQYGSFKSVKFFLIKFAPPEWQNVVVCCFSTGTLQGTNVPRPTRVSSNCTTHNGFLRRAVGDFVTPFVLEKLFDHSCLLLNLQVHTWGKFWKVCLGLSIFHRSVMGEIDLLWM